MESYICSLYPNIPLDLVGFKIGRLEKSKKINILRNIHNAAEIEIAVGSSSADNHP